MFKVFLIFGSGMILFVSFLVSSWPDGDLHINMCDVGQGDAFVLSLRDKQVLVDTGRSMDKLGKCLGEVMPFWDKTIEVVVISHDDNDHDGALAGLKESFVLEKVLDGMSLGTGDRLKVGRVEMEVLAGGGGKAKENEDSLVLRLAFGNFTMMFTGDMTQKEELALMSQRVITPVTVLKVAHHGSKYSSAEKWAEALKPKLVLVSVSDSNNYGHPNAEVLRYFEVLGASVKRSDKEGRVEVVTDGERWGVE